MPVVRAARVTDAAAIAEIYNRGIAEHAATFETEPRSVADIERRLADAERHPVIVAEAAEAGVVGWAGVSEYRPRACYSGIGEFSIYIAPASRGHGVGKILIEALVAAAEDHGYWKLVSRVFTFNQASRALCRATGFREVGTYERHGFLDGVWRDVVIVERVIPANQTPAGLRFREALDADWPAVAALLQAADLPLAGAREHFTHFVVALDRDRIVGAAGLERYGGEVALLRSVILDPPHRGGGAGRLLVARALGRAAREGVRDVVLLTTTADAFFGHLGFVRIDRGDVPQALLASKELTGACPTTAVVMRRRLAPA
jgi:phosphinothricin acetyltransferase